MRLDRLIKEVDIFDRPADTRRVEVLSLTEDNRNIEPGSMFFCVVGATRDGHDFAREAVEKGAVALVVEKDIESTVPLIRVGEVRASIAPIAAAFYEHPSRHMRLAAVTGTNGKSTTVHLLSQVLRQKYNTDVIGTLTGRYTTPPAIEFQRILSEFRERRVEAVAMEASSHALDQHRIDAVRFAVGIFTNLTQDHLDYHGRMSKYFDAKALLFDPGRCERGVVNVDDEWGKKLVERVAIPVDEYSINDAEGLEMTPSGCNFRWRGAEINLPLVGKFNVYNALAAATAGAAMGVSVAKVAAALSASTPVPGRIERVDLGQPFSVLVDFAHTPDGLANVLRAVRPVADAQGGRVITVFGCGGDRDADKRPLMAEAVEKNSDLAILTNDNPRGEDPAEIAKAALAGMSAPGKAYVELDRAAAIDKAIRLARKGDVVVIAGKGHETTQEVMGEYLEFDDRIVARRVLEAMKAEVNS